jgi:hypothetical protein
MSDTEKHLIKKSLRKNYQRKKVYETRTTASMAQVFLAGYHPIHTGRSAQPFNI